MAHNLKTKVKPKDTNSFATEAARKFTESQMARFTGAAFIYMALGVVVFHFLEGFGWIDSLYFVVVTLGTVGYGDLAPQTELGRLFAVFYIIFGVAIFVGFARISFLRLYQRRLTKRQARAKKNHR
jgi:voltage-gated potassium channel